MESSSQKVFKVKTVGQEEPLEVSKEVLVHSNYFAEFLEGNDNTDEVLDMSDLNITYECMLNVIDFSKLLCTHRPPVISKPIKHLSMYEVTSPVFAGFTDKFEDEKLCEMILVADKLVNIPLLELLSAKLAITLSQKSIEDIRKYFEIAQPFDNAEVEKRIKDENEQAEEIYQLNDEDD